MITQDPKIFEEESVTLHHMTYNRETKKLLLEKVNTKNKRSSEKWKSSLTLMELHVKNCRLPWSNWRIFEAIY
jgi:hypothetical protein